MNIEYPATPPRPFFFVVFFPTGVGNRHWADRHPCRRSGGALLRPVFASGEVR